jgi:Taurine catabolism dioxygenase TauD, TfdA family
MQTCASDDALIEADYRNPRCLERITVDRCRNERQLILQRIAEFGFALVTYPTQGAGACRITQLAEKLFLGPPHIPLHYRLVGLQNEYNQKMSNVIRANDSQHLCFTKTAYLAFHVDGLLDPIGKVKTSILYCVRPGAEGGENVVLNSIGLFADLAVEMPEAARILEHSKVLARRCTVPGHYTSAVGPAFTFTRNAGLITRYSDGVTEKWRPPRGKEHLLQRALDFIRSRSMIDGSRRVSFMLQPGEMLVLRNHKLSHAREDFKNPDSGPRHMIRALYRRDVLQDGQMMAAMVSRAPIKNCAKPSR